MSDEQRLQDEQPEAASGEQELDATPENIEFAGDESDAGEEGEID